MGKHNGVYWNIAGFQQCFRYRVTLHVDQLLEGQPIQYIQ